jgi:hypothetical protein
MAGGRATGTICSTPPKSVGVESEEWGIGTQTKPPSSELTEETDAWIV